MGSLAKKDDRRLRRRWEFLLLLLALLMSFVCVFASTWFALSQRSDRVASANMLAGSQADYGQASGEGTRLAPLNPDVGAEAATDTARLETTPRTTGVTPAAIVVLPATPTPTATATPVPAATSTVGVVTPSPTVLASLTPTPTTSPSATATATPSSTPTATSTSTPTGTATPTATSSSTPSPTATSTQVPPPPLPPPPPPPSATEVPLSPVVWDITPGTRVNTAVVPVVITGQNFQSGCSASLGGISLAVSSCTPTTVLASVPVNIVAGFYDLTVTNPDLRSGTLTQAYTATNPIPVISTIKPHAWLSTSVPITITGNSFRNTGAPGGLRAEMGGTPLSAVTYISSTLVTAVVPATTMPTGVYTLTVTNPGPTNPTGSLRNAFQVTSYTVPITVTCSTSGVQNCADAPGGPDGQPATITSTGIITFNFGIGQGITDGPGYDMVFYEWPNTPGIQLDYVTIELSEDGINWFTVFNWDGVPGGVNGTNIDSYATDAGGEGDNEPIQSADLFPGGVTLPSGAPVNTGIAIDIGSVLPPLPSGGPFPWVRLTHPASGIQVVEVDAVVRLN